MRVGAGRDGGIRGVRPAWDVDPSEPEMKERTGISDRAG